jgi:hypothetical protein
LRYVIGDGTGVTGSDIGGALGAAIERQAVPGTIRLFVVDHPGSTDPALREERLVALRLKDPALDTWQLVLLAKG